MDELTSEQLSEWEAYERLEPFGDWKNDYRLAFMCSLLVNVNKSFHGKKNSKMTSPEDFLIKWGRTKELEEEDRLEGVQTVDEMKQMIRSIAATFGKRKSSKGKTKKE